MLEVFNTLLRQLRLSVDYELTGCYDGSTNIGTKIIKAHEERQLQEAVIRTIGELEREEMRVTKNTKEAYWSDPHMRGFKYLISFFFSVLEVNDR